MITSKIKDSEGYRSDNKSLDGTIDTMRVAIDEVIAKNEIFLVYSDIL